MRLNRRTLLDAIESALSYKRRTKEDYGVFCSPRGFLQVVPLSLSPKSFKCLFTTIGIVTEV